MRSIKNILSISMLICLSSTMMLSAEEQTQKVKTVYPVASIILLDSYRYMGALEKFSFDALTTNDDVFHDKMLKEYTHKVHADLQRPANLRINVSGDIKNRSSYLYNDKFTIFDHDLNFYGELKVPNRMDSALDYLFDAFNIKSPLANLLYTDLDKRLAPKNNGYYFGTVQVDGKSCHHIGFVNEKRELQVWIEKGKSPLIKKFSIIDKSSKFHLRSTTRIRWDLQTDLKEKDFHFNPPKGAVEISIEPVTSKGVL